MSARTGRLGLVKLAIRALVALIIAYGALIAWALESGDVAIIETRTSAGDERQTHIWYVSDEDGLWLEAGTPENGWYVDILADPDVILEIDGVASPYLVRPVYADEAQRRVRRGLAEKYGARDRIVGVFVDSTRSIAVHAVPR